MAAGWWGYVTDEYTGEPIAGATVKWSWCGVYGFIGETTTNDQGYYSLTDAVDRNHAGHCETLNCENKVI